MSPQLRERFDRLALRLAELDATLADPAVAGDMKRWRSCIQCMNCPTWVSMIASACPIAERRASRLPCTMPCRSSMV